MGTIANAKVTHYYNCYNGDFIGCLRLYRMLTFNYLQRNKLSAKIPNEAYKKTGGSLYYLPFS